MLESIEREVQTLLKLQNNLKKSINKKYKTETLEAKHQYAVALFHDIETELIEKESLISENKLNFLIKASRESFYDIQQIIKQKLRENLLVESKRNTVTMEPPAAPVAPLPQVNPALNSFDIKTATALVQNYDGSFTGLDTFIDSVSLLSDLTPQEHIATAIKFVKTRLSGKARSALPPNPQTLVELTNAIKQACKSLETPESILAKMKAIKNKGDQQKFCDEVETLSQKLSTLYINNQIPATVANKMATKAGVETLINGVPNTELKIILRASEFDSIQTAIQKIHESQPEPPRILSFHSRGHGRASFGNNSQPSNFSRNRFVSNNDSNRHYGNYSQNHSRRGNGRRNNYRGTFRGNYQNRGRSTYYSSTSSDQHRLRPGHNVFYAQTENCPVPQQIVVGGIASNQSQTPQQQQNHPQVHRR